MANYNLTPRVKVLAERLLAHPSTLCVEHAGDPEWAGWWISRAFPPQ